MQTSILARVMLAALVACSIVRAEPIVPASDDEILEGVAVRNGELGAERARLAAAPDDLDLAVSIAQQYVAQGRKEADPRYYGRAQAVLAPWWSAAEPPLPVLRLRAQVRQSKHDFDGALADLDALLARAPRDADAWFMRAVIYEVRGEPKRALESCAPLWRLADALSTTACLASAASLDGRAQQSYALLAPMIERTGDASAETRAWALTVLAESAARLGRDDLADSNFRAALAAAEPDQYRLSSYSDFLLDRGRNEEVRTLLADRTQMDPLLLRLAIAAQRLHASDAQALSDALGERFAALRARNDNAHLGNEARYELALRGNAARALELAQGNFAVQREPVDLRILLEAALAAGRPEAAREALDWYAQSGLEDARIVALADRLKREGSL
jgi:Tfp pilus assembly protein PilF